MSHAPDVERLLDLARVILRAGPICDACLGSAFGRLGHGWSNEDRGSALRTVLALAGDEREAGRCWVCDGLFDEVESWARRAVERVKGIAFDTYLFGVKPTPRLIEVEALFVERFATGFAEPLKHAFNRSVGKAFEKLYGAGTVDFHDPHVRFTVDLNADDISLRVASLFVYGRYRKLARGIPQTHWPCRRCRGRGCDACEGSGKQYPVSVEELIAGPFLEASGGSGAHLHGAGREDIDARMLGTGRPFVLEICSPHVRKLDLDAMRAALERDVAGRVEASKLRWAVGRTVSQVKEARATKDYRAVVSFEREVSDSDLQRTLESLVGDIDQRTPQRVSHRRADLVRRRRVHEIRGRMIDSRHAEIELMTDGGLYVKELISGDAGRTVPSLSESLGVPSFVVELDVMRITSGEFPDAEHVSMDLGSEVT